MTTGVANVTGLMKIPQYERNIADGISQQADKMSSIAHIRRTLGRHGLRQ